MSASNKVYISNLNNLCFVDLVIVIVYNIVQFKSLFGMENSLTNPFVLIIRKLDNNLFFVLSAFLIAYFLLIEKTKIKNILFKNFYSTSLTKIWPLKTLKTMLSSFLLPFSFFLTDLTLILFSSVTYLNQSRREGFQGQFILIDNYY